MKVELLETVHESWLPKGTPGFCYVDSEGCCRFIPDDPPEGYGFAKDGAYIGSTPVRILGDQDKTTGVDLLNCPHCGGAAKEENTRGMWGGYGLKTIYCQNCGASAPDRKKWNKRVS